MGLPCIHCGEDCGKHPVMWDEKPFCCHGCKTVYQILNEKDLKQYYQIEKMPGIRLESVGHDDRFAYLDLDEIKQKLLEFTDGGISKITLFIPAIHCASCIWLLENMNVLHPGIIHSTVNFPKKEVYLTFRDDEITLRQVVELLVSIHYIPEITLDRLDKKQAHKSNKTLLLKIGITGFVLMNVMMFTFPEYLPGGDLLEEDFKYFFGWISLVLSLPVVFYCANDYFLSAWKSLKHKIISIDLPLALGILALFLQSAWVVITQGGPGYLDSLAGLIFFLLVGRWYQSKTYQALSFERDYKSYFPVAVTRILEGREEVVPLANLQAGDHILVRNQELIPADSTLMKGDGNIDYSFVTGESVPVRKVQGDTVFAGGRQTGSAIELEVSKNVEQSYLTQLWNQDTADNQYNSRLKDLINRVSQYFTLTILFIASLAAGYWLFHGETRTAVFVFTSVLIIACPCALAMTIPFTFGTTMRQYGRQGLYLKKADVIEQLHRITSVVFDKTGTITHSKSLTSEFIGEPLDDIGIRMVKSVVRHSTHPMSVALFSSLPGDSYDEVIHFRELPGLGITGEVDGTKVNIGSCKFVTGKEDQEKGLKSRVYLFLKDHVAGYFQLENNYREGLSEIIHGLEKRFDLHLLTGDNEAEKENLGMFFGDQSNLRFNQTPEDKLNYIRQLKKSGKTVLMVGDGLNDAGALMESDVGITIADDIYHFSPACDAILESSKFGKLNKYILFTNTSLNIVKISFVISFLYNIVGLTFAVQGLLTPVFAAILMPISSISVVAFATFTVSFFARRAFGSESGEQRAERLPEL
jgi:P-type Cu+ transporter